MKDHFTDSPFACGDHAALVSYLYDECDPRERDVIAAHLASCSACADEIDTLSATRRMLPAWTPPEAALGFHVTGIDASPPVLRPARWWQRPLPAWAQAAAAIAIFGAGLAVGRGGDALRPSSTAAGGDGAASVRAVPSGRDPGAPAAPGSAESAAVARDEIARLETELRAELARLADAQQALGRGLADASSVRVEDPGSQTERVTMAHVEALVQERLGDSERRQRGELLWGMEQVLSDVDLQRRRLDAVQTTVEGLGKDTWTNRQSVSALANVFSTQGGFRPVSSR